MADLKLCSKSGVNTRIASSVAALCVLTSGASFAQTSPAGASDSRFLEEIMVTAQRREERLQDVPISISAITANSIERQRIRSPVDLQFQLPSLTYNQFVGYAQPYLRGIGTDISQPNAAPSVATYIDGVYVADGQGILTNMLGLERIEVLVGPQGTLYGRNAVGGAINYYTLTPGENLETKFTVGYGNHDRIEGSGYVSGPISDKFRVGLYAAIVDRDTYLDRQFSPRPESEPEGVTDWGTRLKAVLEPSDDIKFTGSFEVIDSRSPESTAYRQTQASALGYTLFGAAEGPPPRYATNADYPQYHDNRQYAGMFRGDFALGFADLASITGYRRMRGFGSADFDATSAPLFAFGPPVITRSRQFSQEFQLLSPGDSRIDWIIGAYFFTERAGQPDFSAESDFVLAPFDEIKFIGRVSTRSMATFGQITYPVTEDLRLTAGLRYTSDRKKFDGEQYLILDKAVLGEVPILDRRKSWDNLSGKAAIDYRIDETLLYASYSRGYKEGVFNVTLPTNPGPVNPEKIDAFEVGHKSDFLNGRLRINTAAFYYKIKDLQVQTVVATSDGSTILQNAASAKIKGLEFSTVAALSRDLQVNAGVSYLDATYAQFGEYNALVPNIVDTPDGPVEIGNRTVFINAAGHRLARTPKYAISFGGDYEHEFGDGSAIAANIKAHYKDKYYWNAANIRFQQGYWMVNASLSYTLPNTPVTVTAWATNLTDQYYNTILNASEFGVGVFDAPPRMYGLTLTWRPGD